MFKESLETCAIKLFTLVFYSSACHASWRVRPQISNEQSDQKIGKITWPFFGEKKVAKTIADPEMLKWQNQRLI